MLSGRHHLFLQIDFFIHLGEAPGPRSQSSACRCSQLAMERMLGPGIYTPVWRSMMTTVSVTGGSEFETESFASTFTNPCVDFGILFPCGLFGATCSMLEVEPESVGCYYVALFFYVLLIQGLCSGLIAGQLGENSTIAGGKHSMIMVSIVIFIFIFLAKIGVFPG